jgi:hypothetical protein
MSTNGSTRSFEAFLTMKGYYFQKHTSFLLYKK